jgi:multidrug efflux pump subunit AcrA (membrane-fusion protein)
MVERRDFVRTLRIHGVVEAVESHTVAAPRLAGSNLNALTITRLATSGERVKAGDLLVEFDRQNEIKNALDKEAEYRDLEDQIKKKQAEQAAARAKDETELKQAEDALETAKLEMLKNEIVSRIDAEKNQENLEEAKARLKQLRDTFELKRRAAQAEIRILEIQRDRARNAMLHARENAEKMTIRAPRDGLVVLNPIWKMGRMAEVQEGDQVRPGTVFLQVVDPRGMQVRARVNQADSPLVKIGQRVEVHLDAYPELVFPGKVEQMAAIAVTSPFSDKLRTFVATLSIQGSDPKLMPDLSAAVDVELERLNRVLVLPRDAVSAENGQAFALVKNGAGFEKRPVKTGAGSDLEVVIQSGLEAGGLVLRNPTAMKRS